MINEKGEFSPQVISANFSEEVAGGMVEAADRLPAQPAVAKAVQKATRTIHVPP